MKRKPKFRVGQIVVAVSPEQRIIKIADSLQDESGWEYRGWCTDEWHDEETLRDQTRLERGPERKS